MCIERSGIDEGGGIEVDRHTLIHRLVDTGIDDGGYVATVTVNVSTCEALSSSVTVTVTV